MTVDLGNDSNYQRQTDAGPPPQPTRVSVCLISLSVYLPVEFASQVDMAVLEREHSQGAT